MPRWAPNARERLATAALDLYASDGYESTTISDIADRAGVTSRTYFRYYPDKREVLFGGADEMRRRITESLHEAPADLPPLAATLSAMSTVADLYHVGVHENLRRREAVIGTSGELQEREARKLSSMATAAADILITRGTGADEANLVADLAVAIFKHAARLWMTDPEIPYPDVLAQAAAAARQAA